MNRNKAIIAVITAFVMIFACAGVVMSQNISLAGGCQPQGVSTSFSNSTQFSYLKMTMVDPNVNRLRIIDGKNFIYYDGHPQANNIIYLPVSSYTATIWTAYGNNPVCAVSGKFVDTPSGTDQSAQSSQSSATDYGFQSRTQSNTASSTTVISGGLNYAPYSYYNYDYYNRYGYYNNTYNRYNNYNNYAPLPVTPSYPTTPGTTGSILDPNYFMNQKSILGPPIRP